MSLGHSQGLCPGGGAAAFVPRLLPDPAARGRPPARGPPTIAPGVGSCAGPETFPFRLRRRRLPGRELDTPIASSRSVRSAWGRHGRAEPKKGAWGGSAEDCGRPRRLRAGSWPREGAGTGRGGAEPAMGEAPSPAPALWNWDYLDRCFARHRVCISFGLWICSSSCWIAAHAL